MNVIITPGLCIGRLMAEKNMIHILHEPKGKKNQGEIFVMGLQRNNNKI
jgi:hypothetical protein